MARRALISVANKTHLTEFAATLVRHGFVVVSTGGTLQALKEAGIAATPLAEVTKHPEILGGRVKTLHPAVFAGLLQRGTADDQKTMDELGYGNFDVVAVNLYPFVQAANKPGISDEDLIEEIDIGGVSLLRAAAKNHERVTVCSDPSDYADVSAALEAQKDIPLRLRQQLTVRALFRTAAYDAHIASVLAQKFGVALNDLRQVAFGYDLAYGLRYGENPHQQAAAFVDPLASPSLLEAAKLQGKSLSYNNLLDVDSALRAVNGIAGEHKAVIVKHNTPCGAAVGPSLQTAYQAALASDDKSAFGGVVALSSAVDSRLATQLTELFLEVIVARSFSEEAKHILAAKKNVRLLELARMDALTPRGLEARAVLGGVVVQTPDGAFPFTEKVVTKRTPSESERRQLLFAWATVRAVKSNAIVIAVEQANGTLATVGVSGGQTSRVDAVEMSLRKAGERTKGAVMASDAFFPFADSIEAARAAGITAIIQPGGSVKDPEVIAAADAANIAMIFTSVRHFRH